MPPASSAHAFSRINSTNIIESEFAKIVPGETRLSDIAGNVFVRDLDGNEENNSDYIVQPGDLVGILHDASMREFSEHNGGIGYVLREGETGLPAEIQRIWGHALKTRAIFRSNIIAGRTGAETLEILVDDDVTVHTSTTASTGDELVLASTLTYYDEAGRTRISESARSSFRSVSSRAPQFGASSKS